MKNYLILLMLCISAFAISSCKAPEDIIYLQDLTVNNPIDIPEVQYIRAKNEDKLLINVHCRDEKIAKLFNVMGHGYSSFAMSDKIVAKVSDVFPASASRWT